jgi:hypothetical protein
MNDFWDTLERAKYQGESFLWLFIHIYEYIDNFFLVYSRQISIRTVWDFLLFFVSLILYSFQWICTGISEKITSFAERKINIKTSKRFFVIEKWAYGIGAIIEIYIVFSLVQHSRFSIVYYKKTYEHLHCRCFFSSTSNSKTTATLSNPNKKFSRIRVATNLTLLTMMLQIDHYFLLHFDRKWFPSMNKDLKGNS